MLDYPSTQLLLIGEAQGFFGSGGVSKPEEEGAGGMMAGDEIEELETENEVREARQGGLKGSFNFFCFIHTCYWLYALLM